MDAKTRKVNAALEHQACELARLHVEKKENLRSIEVARKQDQERGGKDSELTRLMAEVSGTLSFYLATRGYCHVLLHKNVNKYHQNRLSRTERWQKRAHTN